MGLEYEYANWEKGDTEMCGRDASGTALLSLGPTDVAVAVSARKSCVGVRSAILVFATRWAIGAAGRPREQVYGRSGQTDVQLYVI